MFKQVIKFLLGCFVILCFHLVLSGEFVFFLVVATVPQLVSGRNERSILYFVLSRWLHCACCNGRDALRILELSYYLETGL